MAMRDSSSRAGKVNRLRLARLCVLPATAAVVLLYLGARQGFLIVGIDKLSPSVSPKAGTREPQSSSHSHDRENVHLVSSTDIHAEPEVTEKSDFVKNVAVPTAAAAQSVQKDRKRLRMHQIPNDGRPPFREVVHRNGTILGDVSDLLDFAIIGFGKCGTTTLKSWLDRHPEIQCYPHEVYALAHRQPQELLRLLYYLPEGNYKRGYKSPFDLVYNYTMPYFRRYFPKTPLIVGIRHPVLWFQSLYNFRIQNHPLQYNISQFPRPHELIGACGGHSFNTCTQKGEFGLFLRQLQKVPGLTEFEARMSRAAGHTYAPNYTVPLLPNPVFLVEVQQLSDADETRRAALRTDLQTFLNLSTPFRMTEKVIHSTPGKDWRDASVQAEKDRYKINICDAEHVSVRQELLRMARTSSAWIRNFLLPAATGVRVSSPVYFDSLLRGWRDDPCGVNATPPSALEEYVMDALETSRPRTATTMN
jgi:hypothetical protein